MKIDYISESNVTNIFDLNSLKGLSQFYKEVLTAFSECKTPKLWTKYYGRIFGKYKEKFYIFRTGTKAFGLMVCSEYII